VQRFKRDARGEMARCWPCGQLATTTKVVCWPSAISRRKYIPPRKAASTCSTGRANCYLEPPDAAPIESALDYQSDVEAARHRILLSDFKPIRKRIASIDVAGTSS